MTATSTNSPVFFAGGPGGFAAGGRAGAQHRSAGSTIGVPGVRSTLGMSGQIVIARGAKDERLV
jgi:hypothetical protein